LVQEAGVTDLSEQRASAKSESVPLISDEMVRSFVDADLAVASIEAAYRDYGRERRVLSDPPALLLPNNAPRQSTFKVKGGRLASLGVVGFRMIADRESDAGEQTIDYCWVADVSTGRLIGLVDETWLHRLRTAVTGVVAAKWLARHESHVATIIGAGKIANELPGPLCRAFGLRELRIVARRMESARTFAERHGSNVAVRPFVNVREATKDADIIICISSSPDPVLRAGDLAPGVFVCGMGSGSEIAADVLDRADRFVVDDLEYAFSIGSVRGWVENGMSRDAISRRLDADIGEIAIGAKPGRVHDKEIILSIVQGMACCDVALAHVVLSRAGFV